jgi:prepilin peptidase CpaA
VFATIDRADVELNSIGCRLANSPRNILWFTFAAAPLVLAPALNGLGYSADGWLGSLAGSVLLLLLAVSTVTDLASRKIPNWATYGAALWAVLLNATGPGFTTASLGGIELGAVGIANSIGGAAIGFFVMLLMYRLSGGGAGDVKLAAAIGALVGPMVCLSVLINSYMVAGVFIVGWLIWTVGPLVLFGTLLRMAGSRLLPGWVMPPEFAYRELLNRPVPLAAFFAIGTALALWQHRMI